MIDTENSAAGTNTKTDRSRIPTKKNKRVAPAAPKKSSDSTGEAKEIANVVYVEPKHARQVKNSLQQKGWLQKRYRMIKVEHKTEGSTGESATNNMIALPISAPFSEVVAVFGDFILRHGEEELPLSTSQYASKTK